MKRVYNTSPTVGTNETIKANRIFKNLGCKGEEGSIMANEAEMA